MGIKISVSSEEIETFWLPDLIVHSVRKIIQLSGSSWLQEIME